MNVLGYLRYCFLRSHARGKATSMRIDEKGRRFVTYACPHCGSTWKRAVYRKEPPNAAPQA